MKPIQFILVAALLVLGYRFWNIMHRHPRLRLGVGLIWLSALVFVVFQDSSTYIAQLLGVGRGVDLLMYLSILGLGMMVLLLYLRLVQVEEKLVQLTREKALETTKKTNQEPSL
ncbi:MAG: DUF2304 domain-containing protein [Bacteroidota bacterium]